MKYNCFDVINALVVLTEFIGSKEVHRETGLPMERCQEIIEIARAANRGEIELNEKR